MNKYVFHGKGRPDTTGAKGFSFRRGQSKFVSFIKVAGSVILITAAIVAAGLIVPAGCTREDDTIRVLTQAGYTGIEITGWRPMMAGQDDTFSTGFRATSSNGHEVTGAVTSGAFKGHTIRLD